MMSSKPISTLSSEELQFLMHAVQNSSDAEFLTGIQDQTGIQTATEAIRPHRRQAEFLALDCEEAMFGGALGGGKTEALLKWLQEGVVIPNFSGVFVRRTTTQLQGTPTAPVERSVKFFRPMGGVLNASRLVWKFPNGAMVRFMHYQHAKDSQNFDGHEWHRITVDQVEQLSESQYRYLFSRMRRVKGYPIPCGIRSSANPIGGSWVKRRFVTDEAIHTLKQFTAYDPSPPGMMFKSDCGAIFVPSRIADNKTLDVHDYVERLRSKLGAVLAAKLANGDWSVVEGAILDAENFRYYQARGDILIPLDSNGEKAGISVDVRASQRFATIDTAGTSRQKAQEDKGANYSWSVCGVWDYNKKLNLLFLRHVWRDRVEWKDLRTAVPEVLRQWNVPLAIIESAHHGQPLAEECKRVCNVKLVSPVIPGMKLARIPVEGAKHERAIASGFLSKIEDGAFFMPDVQTVPGVSKWMPEFESELMGWTGRPDETSDQIDICSYACSHTKTNVIKWGGVIRV